MAAERRTWSEWERLVREQKRSGLSVRAFAERRGVNPHTLSWWRWRIRVEPRSQAVVERFVPVVVEATASSEPDLEPRVGTVEVELPGGAKLRFDHPLDVVGLRALAAAFALGAA